MRIRILPLAFFLSIGLVFHIVFVGTTFNWSSVWTWLWLFGWPVMLGVIAFVTFCLLAFIALVFERRF